MLSIAHAETVLAELGTDLTRTAPSGIRVREGLTPQARSAPTPDEVLDRRLAIVRAIVRAKRLGATTESLCRLDDAYVATRMPLDDGETYDE